jgi:hypothetical protein
MGASAKPAKVLPPPQLPDGNKARIEAMAYAALERRIRATQGRRSQFLQRRPAAGGEPLGGVYGTKSLLGQ